MPRSMAAWFACICLALSAGAAFGEKLTPLAPAPDWDRLEPFQETITAAEFAQLLGEVYAPDGAASGIIELNETEARILKDAALQTWFTLRFAATAPRPVPRFWRPAASIPTTAAKPLAGVKIAIDPGHLGGKWAKMEERWFVIGGGKPVAEGDMTLLVAKLLAPRLRKLGAEVSLVRKSAVPLTGRRPEDLRAAAITELRTGGIVFTRPVHSGPDDPLKENSILWHQEKLFYRVSEIRDRGLYLNRRLRPDLTLCLHFNAESWGDPRDPRLVERNHLHVLVNGCYSASELAFDDVRFEMLLRLLSRCYPEEIAASERVAASLAEATGLPPYEYKTPNARRAGTSGYVWTRNLLANRIYASPVIYLEPYVMNNQQVFDRIQLGDYDGTREIDGVQRKSIFREYADAVAEGVAAHYRDAAANH
jgi:hypothetical protein